MLVGELSSKAPQRETRTDVQFYLSLTSTTRHCASGRKENYLFSSLVTLLIFFISFFGIFVSDENNLFSVEEKHI